MRKPLKSFRMSFLRKNKPLKIHCYHSIKGTIHGAFFFLKLRKSLFFAIIYEKGKNMSHVVFLDFDGPLYPHKVLLLPENQPNFHKSLPYLNRSRELNLHPYINYWKMDPFAIAMLNNLAMKDCVFVLSTSWISIHDFSTLDNLLKINGFKGKILEDWSVNIKKTLGGLETRLNRAQSIAEWLSRHPEYQSKYIILDDLSSAPEMAKKDLMKMYGISNSRIFLADIDNGISLSAYKKILNMV